MGSLKMLKFKISFIKDIDNSVKPIWDIIPNISILYHQKENKVEFNFNWLKLWLGIRMIWK